MNADFTPEKEDYKILTPFKMQVLTNFPYIEADFDALTNYELLSKVVEYLNRVIHNENEVTKQVNGLYNAYVSLQAYVNSYFDNLDLQEEVNNKLDDMAESGQLTDIIAQYLGLAGMITFNTVAEMKLAENLVNGSKCCTLGYHNVNDNGKAIYKIRTITNDDVVDEGSIISLHDDTLIAELIYDEYLIPEQIGCYGDGIHDDSSKLQLAFNLGKNILLKGRYKCSTTINIPNAHLLTITGEEIVRSAIIFENEAFLNIGTIGTNVNELRLNRFAIIGDRSQDILLKINYVTNIYMNEISLSESNDYLMELNHGDIVFIDKCIFAGSNETDVWQPCKGIKITSGNPIYITNSNIWNLSLFLDIQNDSTRTITLLHNWIEFVNIIINETSHKLLNANLVINNNNIAFSPHGSISFSNARLINLSSLTESFDILISVQQNNIISYATNPLTALVELNGVTGQTNVYINNNVMFTRLSQMSAYALKVNAKNETKLYYTSTTNADTDYGCQTDGVINEAFSPRELNIKNINLYTSDNELGNVSALKNGHVWYNNGLYIRDNATTKRIPITTRETITNIADTSTATTQEVAAKLNALMDILRRTTIIQ